MHCGKTLPTPRVCHEPCIVMCWPIGQHYVGINKTDTFTAGICCRTRLSLPNMRWSLFYRLSSHPPRLGSVRQLVRSPRGQRRTGDLRLIFHRITGWLNLLGQIAGVASTEYGCAQILLAAVSLGSNGTYSPTAQHAVGVQAGLTIFHGCVNSLSTKWLAKITTSYIVFHMLTILTCSIALLACCKDRNDATYVFTDVTSASGWKPIGFSFLFGFLSVSWTMTDYEYVPLKCRRCKPTDRLTH